MAKTQAKNAGGFEPRLERLRGIVEQLERGDLPLEEGLALYKEGLDLARQCGRQLEAAQHEVKLVQDGLLQEFSALAAAEDEADGQ